MAIVLGKEAVDNIIKFQTLLNDGRGNFLTLSFDHDNAPSSNVSVDFHNTLNGPDGGAMRLVLHPSSNPPPPGQAFSELTLVRAEAPNYQNLNFSTIVTGNGITAGYRFGQELGGNAVAQDIAWATENGVTPGTEQYLVFIGQRVGDSQPVAIQHGHLRFDVALRGGLSDTYWLGYGGAGLEMNAPQTGVIQFQVANQPKMKIDVNGVWAMQSGQWTQIGE